ncbi:MAG TPA: FUSC family protein, partial [Phenylobacterium sp.]|uniref:FUSC family protein n=1 Tax=Phenylobacterium sp. TaxID=1871053 RepID=UPI002B479582
MAGDSASIWRGGALVRRLNKLAAEARGFATPGPRMVDELECVASVLLAVAFGHLADAHNISWAAFSGYMVMRGHVSDTLVRGLLRIAGTGLGALLALAVTPRVAASPWRAAGALAIVGGLTLYGAITRRHAYAWLFVGLTFEMILLDQMTHPGAPLVSVAATRAREVIAGTTACILVSWLSTRSLRRRWPGAPQPQPARLGWSPDAA